MTPQSVLTIALTVNLGLFFLCMGVSILGVLHVRLKTERMLSDSPIVRDAVKEAASASAANFETRIKAVESGWDEFHSDMRKKLARIYAAQKKAGAKGGDPLPEHEDFEVGGVFQPTASTALKGVPEDDRDAKRRALTRRRRA